MRIPDALGDAAFGLVFLSGATDVSLDSVSDRKPKYSEIRKRQQAWSLSEHPARGSAQDHADAIYEAISRLLPAIKRGDGNLSLNSITRAAAALASLEDLRSIDLLLHFSANKHALWTVCAGLHTLVLKGAPIPGTRVALALEPFIAEHEKASFNSSGDTWFAVVEALSILVFSDDPNLGLKRVRQLPSTRQTSYHVREIFVLLGAAKTADSALLLLELAAVPEIQLHFFRDLVLALQINDTIEARRGLLELLRQCSNGQVKNPSSVIEVIVEAVGNIAVKDGKCWEEIESRCKSAVTGLERSCLSRVLAAMGNAEAAIALCDLIHDDFPVTHFMEDIVQNAVLTKSSLRKRGYYTRKPSDCTGLKTRLMGIMRTDKARSSSASQLLGVIARTRLELGYPPEEILNPDFQKGQTVSWQLQDMCGRKM